MIVFVCTVLAFAIGARHAPIRALVSPTYWNTTETSGLKFVDTVVGRDAVLRPRVGVRCNITVHSTGEILYESGVRPLVVDVNSTMWRGVLENMLLGGRRELLVDSSVIYGNTTEVPGGALYMQIEMFSAGMWRMIPPTRVVLLTTLLTSFIPYLLPEGERPAMYKATPRTSKLVDWLNDTDFWSLEYRH